MHAERTGIYLRFYGAVPGRASAAHHRRPGGHLAKVMAYVAGTGAQAQRMRRRGLPRWLGLGWLICGRWISS